MKEEILLNKLNKNNRILVTGPTDIGKTTSIAKVIQPPFLYVARTYEATKSFIAGLKKFRRNELKDWLIVIPMGREKISREFCMQKCKKCILKRKISKSDIGRILNTTGFIDAEKIRELFPEICPYQFLKKLMNYADGVITSTAFIEKNVIRRDFNYIVVDEVDEVIRPYAVLLVRYELSRTGFHLETARDEGMLPKSIGILKKCIEKGSPYKDRDETIFWSDRVRRFQNFLIGLLDELYKIPSVWEQMAYHKYKDFGYAVTGGSIRMIKETVETLKSILKQENFRNLFEELLPGDFIKLPYIEGDLLNILSYGLKNIDNLSVRQVASSPNQGGKGYLEIWLISKKPPIAEKLDEINSLKTIYITATPPLKELIDNCEIYCMGRDPNGDKKLILLVDNKIFNGLIAHCISNKYNILGITTSIRRCREAVKKYGGKILWHDINIKSLEKLARRGGIFVWDYYGSPSCRGINKLHFFDIAFVDEWIPRKPEVEDNKQYLFYQAGVDLYQHVSRIFRTVNNRHRRRACILHDENAYNNLKTFGENWKYKEVENLEQAIEILENHVEKYIDEDREKLIKKEFIVEGKPVIIRHGKKEYIYAKINAEITLPKKYVGKKFKIIVEELL